MKDKKQEEISFQLIFGILFFLTIFIFMGNMNEYLTIFGLFILILIAFALVFIYCIYYKKNQKTLSFWMMVLLGIAVCITMLILFIFSALVNTRWN